MRFDRAISPMYPLIPMFFAAPNVNMTTITTTTRRVAG
jgi:hypothetical protein